MRHVFTEFVEPAAPRTDLAALLEASPAGDLERLLRLQDEMTYATVRTRVSDPVVDDLRTAMAGRDIEREIATASWARREAA
jgi:hypothetical protein